MLDRKIMTNDEREKKVEDLWDAVVPAIFGLTLSTAALIYLFVYASVFRWPKYFYGYWTVNGFPNAELVLYQPPMGPNWWDVFNFVICSSATIAGFILSAPWFVIEAELKADRKART